MDQSGLRITVIEGAEAIWRLRGHVIEMESFTDYGDPTPSYRVRMDGSVVDVPNGAAGTVWFGEAEARPDLVLVREWFPCRWRLWDAVRADFWSAVRRCPP